MKTGTLKNAAVLGLGIVGVEQAEVLRDKEKRYFRNLIKFVFIWVERAAAFYCTGSIRKGENHRTMNSKTEVADQHGKGIKIGISHGNPASEAQIRGRSFAGAG